MHSWTTMSAQILERSAQASARSLGRSLTQGPGHPDHRFLPFMKCDLQFTLTAFLIYLRFLGVRFLRKLMTKYSLRHTLNTFKDLKVTKRWQEVGWTQWWPGVSSQPAQARGQLSSKRQLWARCEERRTSRVGWPCTPEL